MGAIRDPADDMAADVDAAVTGTDGYDPADIELGRQLLEAHLNGNAPPDLLFLVLQAVAPSRLEFRPFFHLDPAEAHRRRTWFIDFVSVVIDPYAMNEGNLLTERQHRRAMDVAREIRDTMVAHPPAGYVITVCPTGAPVMRRMRRFRPVRRSDARCLPRRREPRRRRRSCTSTSLGGKDPPDDPEPAAGLTPGGAFSEAWAARARRAA